MDQIEHVKSLIGKYYILENNQDGLPEPIFEISKEEYEMLIGVSKKLYEFKYFQRKILEIQLNCEDYFKIIERYKSILSKTKNEEEKKISLNVAFVDINRVFINFVSSFKSFLEHFQKRLESKYGKESKPVEAFNTFTKEYYNKYFSYRLFVNLRNYSHHENYPINNIEYVKDYFGRTTIKDELLVSFNRDKLLQSTTLRKKLKVDLMLMNTEFPVHPQMIQIQSTIKVLLNKIIDIEFDKLEDLAKITLMYLSRTYKKEEAKVGYLSLERTNYLWNQTNLEVITSQFLLEKINKKTEQS